MEEEMTGARIPVPGPGAPWWPTVNEFALTYNAYLRVDDSNKVATRANRAEKRFRTTGSVPTTIDGLRTCLFFEQRRWRHFDADPFQDPAAKAYLTALLDALRERTGGFVDGPGDPYP